MRIAATGLVHARFRTARGRGSLAECWTLVPALVARLSPLESEPAPWYVPSSLRFLETELKAVWHVFEVGAGTSTMWWSKRAARVQALESDPAWHAKTARALSSAGRSNVDLRLASPDDFSSFLAGMRDASFDLIAVDGSERFPGQRCESVAAAISKIRPGGFLLLDDSDRPSYAPARQLLAGWTARRFTGFKARPVVLSETTIYEKPRLNATNGDG